MDFNHWLLIFLWLLYFFIHSFLASEKTKLYFEKLMGKQFRYYSVAYIIIASITLLFIFIFQYSFNSPVLINSSLITYIFLNIFLLPGFTIMLICIFKYLKLLDVKESSVIITGQLQTNGIHKYMRHPLYTGTLLFSWGLFFFFPMLNNLIAVLCITLYILAGTLLEEKKLLIVFGEAYEKYMLAVPRFIPFIKNAKNKKR